MSRRRSTQSRSVPSCRSAGRSAGTTKSCPSAQPCIDHRRLGLAGLASVAGLVAAMLAAGSLSGCYQRVVGVKNDPGYQGKVYEPNLKDGEENAMVELFTVERSRPVSK